MPIRQFLLGNLYLDPETKTRRFLIPLSTLAKSINGMGDFPFKDPMDARFEKPALFVRGTRSSYVPDDVLPLIGQFFPRFRVADVEAGHWLISERPEDFRKGMWARLSPSPPPVVVLVPCTEAYQNGNTSRSGLPAARGG